MHPFMLATLAAERARNRRNERRQPAGAMLQSAGMQPYPPYRPPQPPAARRPRGGRRPGALKATVIVVFGLFLTVAMLGFVAVVGGAFVYSRDLHTPSELERIVFPEDSIIYDRNGTVLARLTAGGESRRTIAWEDVPPVLADAVTAVEDKTFWANTGIGPSRNRRSRHRHLHRRCPRRLHHHPTAGAPEAAAEDVIATSQRLGDRNIKELIQSVRVTDYYRGVTGKQDILTAYLNQNFYGNNSYGVLAAAKSYFDVNSLADLTLSEAATLAALPQAPPPTTCCATPSRTMTARWRCRQTRPSRSGATWCCACWPRTPPGASSAATPPRPGLSRRHGRAAHRPSPNRSRRGRRHTSCGTCARSCASCCAPRPKPATSCSGAVSGSPPRSTMTCRRRPRTGCKPRHSCLVGADPVERRRRWASPTRTGWPGCARRTCGTVRSRRSTTRPASSSPTSARPTTTTAQRQQEDPAAVRCRRRRLPSARFGVQAVHLRRRHRRHARSPRPPCSWTSRPISAATPRPTSTTVSADRSASATPSSSHSISPPSRRWRSSARPTSSTRRRSSAWSSRTSRRPASLALALGTLETRPVDLDRPTARSPTRASTSVTRRSSRSRSVNPNTPVEKYTYKTPKGEQVITESAAYVMPTS